MMRTVIVSLLSLLLFPSIAFAQAPATDLAVPASDVKESAPLIYPRPSDGVTTFLGQNHAYSVVFRGNGEAVVSLRVALTNGKDTPLKEIEMRLPSEIQASEVVTFQVMRDDKPCLIYENPPVIISYGYTPVCKEYGEPDYYQFYGPNKYQKAGVEISGDTLKITLPSEIKKDASGAFFVYLRANGYVKRDMFGVYNFDFESLKINDSIQSLAVGISTDSDLFIKGAKGEVNYRFEDQAMNLSAVGGGAEKGSPSPAIDNFYSQIGYGTLNKNASSLAPLESYEIKGAYAKNRISLYGREIFVGILILGILTLLTLVSGRFLLRKMNQNSKNLDSDTGISPSRGAFLITFFVSLGSAVLIGLYTGAIFFLSRLLSQTFVYGYDYIQFAWLLMAVISFAVYALLIIAPSIFVGMKKGMGWGLTTLGLTVFWLVILVITFLILGFFSSSPDFNYPPIMPLEKSVGDGIPQPLEVAPDK